MGMRDASQANKLISAFSDHGAQDMNLATPCSEGDYTPFLSRGATEHSTSDYLLMTSASINYK